MKNFHSDRPFWSVISKAASHRAAMSDAEVSTLEMRDQPIMVIPNIGLPTRRAEDYIHWGDVLFQQGLLDGAIAHYRRAIQTSPNCSEAFQHLADALTQQGNLTEAAQCYRQAIALETTEETTEMNCQPNLEDSFTIIKTDLAEDRNRNFEYFSVHKQNRNENEYENEDSDYTEDDIENDADETVDSIGELPWFEAAAFHIQQTQVLCEEGAWSEALQNAQSALEHLEPNIAGTYFLAGLSLQEQGNFAEAEALYQKALVIQPQDAEVFVQLGSLFAQQQAWEQAIEHYQKAVALQPNFAEAHWALAEVYEQVGESIQAALAQHRALMESSAWGTVQERIQLGQLLLQAGYAQEAIDCLRDAVRQDPDNATLYHAIGTALGQLEQWQEALLYLQNAVDRNLKDPTMRVSLGQAFEALEQFQKATQCYESAIRLAPQNPVGHLALRDLLVGKGEWREALPHYQTLAILQPDRAAEAYIQLGDRLQRQGEPDRAIDCYHWAIHAAPENAFSYYRLGKALTEMNPQEALFYLRRAIQYDSQNSELLAELAAALVAAEAWQEAIECYQQMIQLQPDNVNIYHQLKNLLAQLEQWQEALPYYQKIAELQPDNAIAWHELGDAAARLEQWEDAIGSYQQAIDRDPSFPWSYNSLGDALRNLGQWRDAVKAYQQAIALNPECSWSYNNLGDAYRQLGKWKEAVEAYRQAIDLNPDFYWSHYNLGEALAKLGQHDRAIEAFERMIEVNPDENLAGLKLYKALHHRAKVDLERVLVYYREAIEEDPGNIDLLHQAIELEPGNADFYISLTQILIEKNQLDQARVFYEMALQLQPELVNASQTLQQLLLDQGRPQNPQRLKAEEILKAEETQRKQTISPAEVKSAMAQASKKKVQSRSNVDSIGLNL